MSSPRARRIVFGYLGSGVASEIDLAQVRLAELVAALSLGIYLGFGQPMAASSLLLPRWGGLARFAAGLVCLGVSASSASTAPAGAPGQAESLR